MTSSLCSFTQEAFNLLLKTGLNACLFVLLLLSFLFCFFTRVISEYAVSVCYNISETTRQFLVKLSKSFLDPRLLKNLWVQFCPKWSLQRRECRKQVVWRGSESSPASFGINYLYQPCLNSLD